MSASFLMTLSRAGFLTLASGILRPCMDLTEAEDIKKRWQKYTEELYKQDFHYSDNYDGVITHLEPDILKLKSSGP